MLTRECALRPILPRPFVLFCRSGASSPFGMIFPSKRRSVSWNTFNRFAHTSGARPGTSPTKCQCPHAETRSRHSAVVQIRPSGVGSRCAHGFACSMILRLACCHLPTNRPFDSRGIGGFCTRPSRGLRAVLSASGARVTGTFFIGTAFPQYNGIVPTPIRKPVSHLACFPRPPVA
jgi:hypothetical protein